MFKGVEHIGIAVERLEDANQWFGALSGLGLLKTERVESEGVEVSFFQVGSTKIEFLAPTSPDSAIAKHLAKFGPGIHHIAFAVEDVGPELERLKEAGFELIHQVPKQGADGKLIAFLHPKSTGKVLTEICSDAPKN